VLALRLIIQAAQDQELKLMVSREGSPEALGFAVAPVRSEPAAGGGGAGGLIGPGGGLLIPRVNPTLENLKPAPRVWFEEFQGDRGVVKRLDDIEKTLESVRQLLERAGIMKAVGEEAPVGAPPEDPADPGDN
jgi:hypothetical protein